MPQSSADPQVWPIMCGTGHRHLTGPQCKWMDDQLERILVKLTEEHGLETVVSGMALLFDQRLAEMAKFFNLRLVAMIPFPGQADRWPPAAQDHWHEILAVADEIVAVSDVDPDPARPNQAAALLHKRNDAMLNVSNALIACADHRKIKRAPGGRIVGGTWSAIDKAVRRGLPIIWMDPNAETVRIPTRAAWERILTTPAGQR